MCRRQRLDPFLCEKLRRLRAELQLLAWLEERKIAEYNLVIEALRKRYRLDASARINLETYQVIGGEEHGDPEST